MGQSRSYTKVMGMNFYGRMLLKNPMRESEATKLLKASENLASQLPYWYDKIEQIYLPDFDLE